MKTMSLLKLIAGIIMFSIFVPVWIMGGSHIIITLSAVATITGLWVYMLCRVICLIAIGIEFIPFQYFWKASAIHTYKGLKDHNDVIVADGTSLQARGNVPYLCIHGLDTMIAFDTKTLRHAHLEYVQWIDSNQPELGDAIIVKLFIGASDMRIVISQTAYAKAEETYKEITKSHFWKISDPDNRATFRLCDRSGGVKRLNIRSFWDLPTQLPVEYFVVPKLKTELS